MSNMSETFSPTSYKLANADDSRILPIENFSIDKTLNSSILFRYETAGHTIENFRISFSAICFNNTSANVSVTCRVCTNNGSYYPDGIFDDSIYKYILKTVSPGETAHSFELYFARRADAAGEKEFIDIDITFDPSSDYSDRGGYVIAPPVMVTNIPETNEEEQELEPETNSYPEADDAWSWESLSGDARSYLAKNTYFPSEIASEIRKLKDYIGSGGTGSAGLSKLDSVHFGGYELDVLSQLFANPGLTDPKYYEEIAESIDAVTEAFAETICGEWTIVWQDGGE